MTPDLQPVDPPPGDRWARLREPVYGVGAHRLSVADLLSHIATADRDSAGMPRTSDLHLKVGAPARFRLDSDLVTLPGSEVLTAETVAAIVGPLLSEDDRAALEKGDAGDLDRSCHLPDEVVAGGLTVRLNVFADRDGLACTIRALPATIPDLAAIGFPGELFWRRLVELRGGLVLVTGITGSGKSTTVASLLQHINRHRAVRIITIEDPIEYVFTSERALISQREVGHQVGSFEEGLRSALREDPDIIFVGEMRDRETAAMALSAAETGHLVFSTMHTRDAVGAVTRIADMFPPDRVHEIATQLSMALTAIIAQKLVPRARESGRRVAMEVLFNTASIGNLIRTARWHQIYSTMESASREGQLTLERHLLELVRAGEIARDQALRFANHPALLA